jgi:CotH kinase protein
VHRLSHATLVVIALIGLAGCGAKADTPTLPIEPPAPVPTLQAGTPKLPVLSIRTSDGAAIVSREVYVTGTMSLADTTGALLSEGALEIRGRGNTTWMFPKKPYRVKLTTSTALLGMPASRHWVLLANYSDKTMVRNDLSFALSSMLGMAWTPRSRFVDLRVNGQYDGVYQLTEHVRIAPDRVNITALKVSDTSATNITGGYLLEVDERKGQTFCFNSTMTTMIWCAADPETLLDPGWEKHRAYITNYIARTDSAIFGSTFADTTVGYAAFIDVQSAIDYYMVQEVVKNVDGNLRFGASFHKPRGGKLFFGPVWDFDLAFGNVNYNTADQTSGWYARQSLWFTRLFQDPVFRARFNARWAEMKRTGVVDSLQNLVIARASYLSVVQVKNFERWPILGTYVWPNRVVTGSYNGEAIALKGWLADRVRWMDAEVAR